LKFAKLAKNSKALVENLAFQSQQPAILTTDIKIITFFTIAPPNLVVLGSYHGMNSNITLLCTESVVARLVMHLTCNNKNSCMSALEQSVEHSPKKAFWCIDTEESFF